VSGVIPVRVQGVAVLPPDETPVMLLRETVGDQRWLPISIGVPEANALVAAHEHIEHARPDTIELIGHVIEVFECAVRGVEVTALDDGVFFSDLVLDNGVRISARPSDAVAIGVRAGVPLEVDEAVLDMASVELEIAGSVDTEDLESAPAPEQEQEIASFRAGLDDITADDFDD
jgi:bifunctional DNase/RNase